MLSAHPRSGHAAIGRVVSPATVVVVVRGMGKSGSLYSHSTSDRRRHSLFLASEHVVDDVPSGWRHRPDPMPHSIVHTTRASRVVVVVVVVVGPVAVVVVVLSVVVVGSVVEVVLGAHSVCASGSASEARLWRRSQSSSEPSSQSLTPLHRQLSGIHFESSEHLYVSSALPDGGQTRFGA